MISTWSPLIRALFLPLGLLLIGLWLPAATRAASPADTRPNVVFILADDLGYTDVACYGSRYYETPQIDRLAAQGMRFTSGYTCGPNCQPTRAALMSGQYGPRTGVYTVGGIDRFNWQSRPLRPVDNVEKLAPDKVTVAEALQKAGYATGLFGKWHLGEDPQHHPLAAGLRRGDRLDGPALRLQHQPQGRLSAGQLSGRFPDRQGVGLHPPPRAGPFFLCLHHFAVHSPHQAKEELIQRFKPKPPAGGHHTPPTPR